MTQFFKLVAELGLPIAATVGMGVFILFSEQLGIPIDTDRVARADGKIDARKD